MEPTKKKTVVIRDTRENPDVVAVSGVHGLRHENRVKFFVLGSVSRGIPEREWEISVEGMKARAFTFYPQADVMAIAGNQNQERRWE